MKKSSTFNFEQDIYDEIMKIRLNKYEKSSIN